MVIYCVAYGCKAKFVKGSGITFHSFPKDEMRRKLWTIKLKRKNFQPTNHSKLCSNHFMPECFNTNKLGGTWLKDDAVPTIFNFPPHMQKYTLQRKPPNSGCLEDGTSEAENTVSSTVSGKEVQKGLQILNGHIKSMKILVKSGGTTKSRKPYKQMNFFEPTFQQRENSGNMNTDHMNDSVDTKTNDALQVHVPKEVVCLPKISKAISLATEQKSDISEQEILDILKANIEELISQPFDPDELFFLFQLPVIKKMRPSEKLGFKAKFVKLLQSYTKTSNSSSPSCS